MLRRARSLLPVLIGLLLGGVACCGYSARSLVPSHLGTIGFTAPENTTMQPGLGDLLNEELTAAFRRDRSLRVVPIETADLLLTVTVGGYGREPTAYTGEQEISTYDVRISASYVAEDVVRDETFHEGTATARVTYDPDSESEVEATARALTELAEDVVRGIITAW